MVYVFSTLWGYLGSGGQLIIGHIVIAKDIALLGLSIPKKKGEELTLSREGKRILPEMENGKKKHSVQPD